MESRKSTVKFFYALSLAFQLGFIIAAPIIGFILLGLWFDRKFSTLPLFLVSGIIAGVLVTFYELYHFVKPLLK